MRRRGALLGLALCLLLVTCVPWAIDAANTTPAADFAPLMNRRTARAAVREAQARQTTRQGIGTVYFAATGHHLGNGAGFLDFWRANGQVLIFGYPVTEEVYENGRLVQYFERARFEHHPELGGTPYAVQLGLLGVEAAQRGNLMGGFTAVSDPQNGSAYFGETGHTVFDDFYRYWVKHGDIATFGFPISEPFEENGRIVQYFERHKLEYTSENMEEFYRAAERWNGLNLATLHEVTLADLGRQAARAAGHPLEPVAQQKQAPAWSPALWPRGIEVNVSTQQLVAYEGDMVVYRAPVATGRNGFNTPTGNFAVYAKLPIQTMRGNAGGETWNVPNVPSVMYINGGVALHGTYWHAAFGTGARLSHGCINLGMDDAQWLYEWADVGTPVRVFY